MSLAKDRLYRRLEKFLITIESMLVGGFLGFCLSLADANSWPNYLGALTAIISFIVINNYKRYVIKKERS